MKTKKTTSVVVSIMAMFDMAQGEGFRGKKRFFKLMDGSAKAEPWNRVS